MAQNPPDVWAFLSELVNRLGEKNPVFFNVLAWIAGAAAFVSGVPYMIDQLEATLGITITLPAFWEALESKVLFWCSVVGIFYSNLAVKKPVVQITNQTQNQLAESVDKPVTPAKAVELTDKKTLPFTAKKQEQEAVKNDNPPLNFTAK
jgi:hypothetical protein